MNCFTFEYGQVHCFKKGIRSVKSMIANRVMIYCDPNLQVFANVSVWVCRNETVKVGH